MNFKTNLINVLTVHRKDKRNVILSQKASWISMSIIYKSIKLKVF